MVGLDTCCGGRPGGCFWCSNWPTGVLKARYPGRAKSKRPKKKKRTTK